MSDDRLLFPALHIENRKDAIRLIAAKIYNDQNSIKRLSECKETIHGCFRTTDDQDKDGFKLENVGPTFSSFAVVMH